MARWDSFVQFLQEADQLSNDVSRQQLVEQLLSERPRWPWIEGNLATFIHLAENAENVALNLDIIERDPPFEIMGNLEGTDLWYVQREFAMDDLLDYMIVFSAQLNVSADIIALACACPTTLLHGDDDRLHT
ncbi:MAG: hypothetical protein AAFQ07_07910, partial [Chloroflexota bacterium]